MASFCYWSFKRLSKPTSNPQKFRYEDGEVRRYGAGESYRPYNRDRSPRPARSPPPRSPPRRSPVRDNLRDNRDRGRTPPGGSDSYVPGRSPPRRRSRSNDRFRRRERSRDPEPWRRRDRSRSRPRSPMRRNSPPPHRSPMRRSPPRFTSPRRDDRRLDDRRDDRDERPRSPGPRRFDTRDIRPRSRSPFNRDRLRRDRSPFRRSPPAGPRGGSYRPRSRSIDRRNIREDRYPGQAFRRPSIPPRDSVNSSAINSRSASGPSSPRQGSFRGRGGSRSRQHSPSRVATPTTGAATPAPAPAPQATQPAPEPVVVAHRGPEKPEASSSIEPSELRDTPENTDSVKQAPRQQTREPPKQPAAQDVAPAPPRSPPKGPAALRAPPTGPAAGRNFSSPLPQHAQLHRPAQTPTGPSRSDMTSPTIPPAGPRGYVPPRGGGGFASRGGRGGGWNNMAPRHMPGPSVSPTIPPTGPTGIPTGPRAATTNNNNPSLSGGGAGGGGGSGTATGPASTTSSPSLGGGAKPFNPPTGPSAQSNMHNHNHHHNNIPPQRQSLSLAQNLLSTMPPILSVAGKLDPELSHISLGVTRELEPHFRKLLEDEERQREDLYSKQEKLRKNLKIWDKLERESKAFELKSDLSEKSLQNLAGEGGGGSAF